MHSAISFLSQVSEELKKVVWPTRSEVIRLTMVVILVSLFVGVFLGGTDFLLTKLMEVMIK